MTQKGFDTPLEVGRMVRNAIQSRYKTKVDFCRTIGILPTNLQNILSGQRYIPKRWAKLFADELGFNLEYLLYGVRPVFKQTADFQRMKSGDDVCVRRFFWEKAALTPDDKQFLQIVLENSDHAHLCHEEPVSVPLRCFEGKMDLDTVMEVVVNLYNSSYDSRLQYLCPSDIEFMGGDPSDCYYIDSPGHGMDFDWIFNTLFAPRTIEEVRYEPLLKSLGTSIIKDKTGRTVDGFFEITINTQFLVFKTKQEDAVEQLAG